MTAISIQLLCIAALLVAAVLQLASISGRMNAIIDHPCVCQGEGP